MKDKFDWQIEGKSSLIDLKFKDVWSYRDLLWLLVRRDFVSFYKQTILGPLWFFIQPLLTTVMFTFVFGKLGGFKTDGLTKTSTVFKDNANIFGKVYFPRLIMPLSIVMSNLVKFGVQMILFMLMIAYYVIIKNENCIPNYYILLFPVLIILMAILGLGMGMIISALTTKYRDLSFLVTFGVQLLMYATTVVYPLSTVKSEFSWMVKLNPMTSIIETFRYGFLGNATFSWSSLAYTSSFAFIVLFLGIIIFNKVERTFVDTI